MPPALGHGSDQMSLAEKEGLVGIGLHARVLYNDADRNGGGAS